MQEDKGPKVRVVNMASSLTLLAVVLVEFDEVVLRCVVLLLIMVVVFAAGSNAGAVALVMFVILGELAIND